MDRNALARRAYNTACDRIARDTSLSTSEKRHRYFRLSNAYEARLSILRLSSFISFHRLDRIISTMQRDHFAGRVGETNIKSEAA